MITYTLQNPLRPLERALLKRIAGSAQSHTAWKTFPNAEVFVRVAGVKPRVCVIGRTDPPGDHFLKTILLIDTLRRAGARDITLVLPYFAYGRQDRKKNPYDALGAAAVAQALSCAGARRIVTVDLHSNRILRTSPVRIESVSVFPKMATLLRSALRGAEFSIVAPDRGGLARARELAAALGKDGALAWCEKKRIAGNRILIRRVHGDLRGATAVLVDDILDTGKTIQEAVRLLKRKGFTSFYLCVTHPIFSEDAAARIRKLGFTEILISDAIPTSLKAGRIPHLRVVSAVEALADAVVSKKR